MLAVLSASTVVPFFREIVQSESPLWTTYLLPTAGVGVAVGGTTTVAVGIVVADGAIVARATGVDVAVGPRERLNPGPAP